MESRVQSRDGIRRKNRGFAFTYTTQGDRITTPLLLLTGETSPQRLQSVREAGVPVLFKPVVPERLLQALEAVAH